MFCFKKKLFGAIIKKDIAAKELKIFAEDGLSYEKLDVVYEKVRSAMKYCIEKSDLEWKRF